MSRIRSTICAGAILAGLLLFLTWPAITQAQEMSGVNIQVIAEYPVADIPGVKAVRLLKLTIEPGGSITNLTIGEHGY